MMTWLTSFLEENKDSWKARREDQERQKRREQWESQNMEERKEKFYNNERTKMNITGPEEQRKIKLEKALTLKMTWRTNWKKWRTTDKENDEYNDKSEEEEIQNPSSPSHPTACPTPHLSSTTILHTASTLGSHKSPPCSINLAPTSPPSPSLLHPKPSSSTPSLASTLGSLTSSPCSICPQEPTFKVWSKLGQ